MFNYRIRLQDDETVIFHTNHKEVLGDVINLIHLVIDAMEYREKKRHPIKTNRDKFAEVFGFQIREMSHSQWCVWLSEEYQEPKGE